MDSVGSAVDITQAQPWIEELRQPARLSTILVVGHADENLSTVRIPLERDGHEVLTSSSGADALEILNRVLVDLVIMEARDSAAVEFCCRLRGNHRTELMPLLMVSAVPTVELEIACIGSGADTFLRGPFSPEVLSAMVRSLLRRKAVVDRLEESETILLALAQAVELRDNITAGHCDRLAVVCVAMGMAMNLPQDHLQALHRGGYLHDIGKIGMP